MPTRFIRVDLYAIHAHVEGRQVDYAALFSRLAEAFNRSRIQRGTRELALKANYDVQDSKLFLVAYTGSSETNTFFFDTNTQQEIATQALPGVFQARKTHVMVDARRRLLLIDTKRGSFKLTEFEELVESFGRTMDGYQTLEVDFNPVADTDFITEIDNMDRIQQATVRIARPNFDWTDWNHKLNDVADESNAGAMDITARSRRDKSLAKDSGLVHFVKLFLTQPHSFFKKVRIIGSLGDDGNLTTLDLSKHIEHITVQADTDPVTGQLNEGELRDHMKNYLDNKN